MFVDIVSWCAFFYSYRLGESEECAGTVAFLVSDDAKYITGETVVTAGGWQSRL